MTGVQTCALPILHVVEGALPIDARIALEAWAGGTLLRFRARGQPRGPMRIIEKRHRAGGGEEQLAGSLVKLPARGFPATRLTCMRLSCTRSARARSTRA